MACRAHVRRKLYDVFKADYTSGAAVAIEKIKGLYKIERPIDAEPVEIRRRARKLSKLKILDFFVWADDILARASARSPLAEALRYAVKLKRNSSPIPTTAASRSTTTSPRTRCAVSVWAARTGYSQALTAAASALLPCIR